MIDLINFFVAILAGVLVGTERQWQARDFPDGTYAAGLRTFSLIGAFGGLSGILSTKVSPLFGVVSFLSVSIFLLMAYYRESSGKDKGLTTEIGALALFFSSFLCGMGNLQIGMASAVTIFIFLTLKKQLHLFIKQLGEKDIFAIIKFLVMIAIIYPIIPDKDIFPGVHLNPAEIFKMVIIISGISMVSYVFVRIYGAKKGILVSSFFGSLVSSTAVTINVSKIYRDDHGKKPICQRAGLFACGVMYIRVFVITILINSQISARLFFPFLLSALVLIFFSYFRSKSEDTVSDSFEVENPANISTSLKFGLLLGVVFWAGDFAITHFGDRGIVVLSLLSGVSDVDAITITLSKLALGSKDINVFVIGIFVAATVNTLVKGIISIYAGGVAFGVRIFGILLLSVAMGLLWSLWMPSLPN